MNKFLTSVKALLCVWLLLFAFMQNAFPGTVTGQVQTPSGGALANATFSFTLLQSAVVSGTATVAPVTVNCFTDGGGNVVGEPNPLVAPIVSANLSGGTLPAATYFVKLTYFDGTGESVASPEATLILSGTGTLVVTAPTNQPTGASGYKVYISTATGTETLQGTVTGTPGSWGNFSQASALGAGTALPGSNTTACKMRFNDELQPSFVCYDVSLINSAGVTLPGYPQYWYLAGGTAGTVNIGAGTPQSTVCQGAGIFYPQAIVAQPIAGVTQSIAGGLDLGTNNLNAGSASVGGAVTAGSENGIQVVGNGTNTNIAAAVTAASTTGAVMIPPGYVGTDAASTSTAPIVDYRQNAGGYLTTWHGVWCGMKVVNFPGGNDCNLATGFGTADIHLINTPLDITSTTSLNIGANPSVIVNSTVGLSHAPGTALIVGQGTATAELVTNANWNCTIVGGGNNACAAGTTLSITVAAAHPQPVAIRQIGQVFLDTPLAVLSGGLIVNGVENTVTQFPEILNGPALSTTAAGIASGDGVDRNHFQYINASLAGSKVTATQIGWCNLGTSGDLCIASRTNQATRIGFFTSPDAGTTGGVLQLQIDPSGVVEFTKTIAAYNGVVTAGMGVAPIYAGTSQKAESAADTSVLTFTPPASAGTYRINFALSLSAANAAILGWTATWKDSNAAAQAPTNLSLFQSGAAAPALTFTTSAAGNYYGSAVVDVDNSATAIVVKLTFTGTSFTGKASATIERIQ